MPAFRFASPRTPRPDRRRRWRAPALETLESRALPSFAAPPAYLFGRDPAAVAVADFTGTGNQDVVVADDTAQTLTLLLGNGDGTFRNAGTIPHDRADAPALAVGDFNGDGIPDLAVGNRDGVDILLGNGDGTFRDAGVTVVFGRVNSSVAVADFTGNGKADIVLTTVTDGGFELLGNGDGTFQAPISLPALGSSSIVAGDVLNNGHPDLLAGTFGGSAELLAGNGDGTFQSPVPFAPGLPLTVTDLNGDGIPDLVLPTTRGISERLGNGDGTFQGPIGVSLPADTSTTILGVGDFTNDGLLDVVIKSGGDAASVLLNNGAGSFTGTPAYATGTFPDGIAAGDFTGSGLSDLVTVGYDGLAHVLLNNGDGTFHSAAALPNAGVGGSVVVGAFTGDGHLDFASFNRDRDLNDREHAQVNIFLGNGDGTFQTGQVLDLGVDTVTTNGRIVAGDFTGSGRADLAVLFFKQDTYQSFVEVLRGNGDGTFQATTPQLVESGGPAGLPATGLAAGDLNGDGKLDLVVTNSGHTFAGGGTIYVLLGNGDGTFRNPTPLQVPENAFDVAVGDVNGDGTPDLLTVNLGKVDAFGNLVPNSVGVLLGNGDGSFRAPVDYPIADGLGVSPHALVLGSFGGNGILDVVVVDSSSNAVSVLQGNGDGSFQSAVHYLAGAGPSAVATGDFNGDGALDLATVNFESNDVSVLLNRNDGAPAQARGEKAIHAPAADVLVTGAWAEPPPAAVGQQPPVETVDAAFSYPRLQAVTAPSASQAPADGSLARPYLTGDPTGLADAAGLADPLGPDLAAAP